MEPIKRIVVATDFSVGADKALNVAIQFAKRFDATLDLTHVFEPLLATYPSVTDLPRIEAAIDQLLTERCQRARSSGVVCNSTSVTGRAATEIVRHAQKTGSQMIVMGTHGLTGLSHAILGSVAERVVQKAGCLVLTVPARD